MATLEGEDTKEDALTLSIAKEGTMQTGAMERARKHGKALESVQSSSAHACGGAETSSKSKGVLLFTSEHNGTYIVTIMHRTSCVLPNASWLFFAHRE